MLTQAFFDRIVSQIQIIDDFKGISVFLSTQKNAVYQRNINFEKSVLL